MKKKRYRRKTIFFKEKKTGFSLGSWVNPPGRLGNKQVSDHRHWSFYWHGRLDSGLKRAQEFLFMESYGGLLSI
jgi:hypothetical protein